ncbi:hypothetical protein MNBD_NITROSPINAE02-1523 [hydrothermal vent metagenome]|uniref:Porin domain-containing protein n=1 Tax=hydrothermal vent metagenome TaxID=652676 RepID=A0A3B1CD57_9ZZZZ
MSGTFGRGLAIAVFICLPVTACSASAFYLYEENGATVDVRGFARLIGWGSDNPDIDFIYENKNDYGLGGIGRLLVDGRKGENIALELNIFELYTSSSATFNIEGQTQADVERSALLAWSQIDGENQDANLTFDRINISYSFNRIDLTVGRQAVNLATTYYFTPNDFFAPFAAQTFYRVYKSGVDAARAEIRLGELTQATILGVMGYKRDPGAQSGWSDQPDWDRASTIARISTVFLNFEWGAIAGNVRGSDVIGGSIQGELPFQIGLRVEGNYQYQDEEGKEPAREISAEVEKRFDNTLILRLAYFHNGAGADAVKDYALEPGAIYIARRYAALGMSYEFTPLLYGEFLFLENLVDDSYSLAFYSVYSLSDEAEFSAGLSIPFGEKPSAISVGSEYGAQPIAFNLELRTYF